MKGKLTARLKRLEGSEGGRVDWETKLFAIVRGPIDVADDLPARLGLTAERVFPVLVTEDGWNGGQPVVVSPLANLDGATDEGLCILSRLRFTEDAVIIPPRSVVVDCVVGGQGV